MARTIPTYELYGEFLSGGAVDPVHYEPLHERSSKHDWTIRLHRHNRLAQVFLFRSAGVFVRLGDITYTSTEPMILVVPPGVVHGFQFARDVSGDVLSLPVNSLNAQAQDRLNQFAQGAGGILPQSTAGHFKDIEQLMQQLRVAFQSIGTERTAILEMTAQLIITYLSADLHGQMALAAPCSSQPLSLHEAHTQTFCTLVEAEFARNQTVGQYAARIGVSAPHLTRICKSILGITPNELVRQRRIVEAKRLLEYTRLPISDIAHRSGFRDPAFFSRTFKASSGHSPQSYRALKGH